MDSSIRIPIVARCRAKEMKWNDIAEILDEPIEKIKSEFKRYQEVKNLPPKPRVRKSMINGHMGLAIKQIRSEKPSLPLRDFSNELVQLGFDKNAIPSHVTIARFFNDNGYIMRKLVPKTFVHPRNVEKRLIFAQEHHEKDEEYWDNIIWSDETTVRQKPLAKQELIHVHKSVEKENLPINGQIHSGGFSVMFWGCFSKVALGPLVALEGSMDARKYVQLLEDVLLPELEAAGRPMVFMQDNAPCHTAKLVADFFERKRVTVLKWPPQSPDLNPIENLWAIVKSRRKKKFGTPSSKAELVSQVFKIWEEIDQNLVSVLADSANRRLKECIRLKGAISKY